MQGDLHVAGGQGDLAAFLPVPVGALGAELGRKGLAVQDQLEAAGGAGGLPVGHPVLGAHPDAVFAGRRNPDRPRGVVDGLAEAMGQQVGRADDVREGGVELPAAMGGQGLGLDEDRRVLGQDGRAAEQGQAEDGKEAGKHGDWIPLQFASFQPKSKKINWPFPGRVLAGVMPSNMTDIRQLRPESRGCSLWRTYPRAAAPRLTWSLFPTLFSSRVPPRSYRLWRFQRHAS